MEKLHLVGCTEEGDGLLFATGTAPTRPTFVVAFDDALRAAIAEVEGHRGLLGGTAEGGDADQDGADALTRVDGRRVLGERVLAADIPPARAERHLAPPSTLAPRELQDRLRAGWSVAEVATSAGVSTEWVTRFAVPVLAEQAQIVDRAIALRFDKPRVGLSAAPLVDAVRRNIAERGVRLFDEDYDACWSAFQLGAGWWALRFRYRSRGRLQEALWRFEPDTGELRSDNRLAHQLGHVSRKGRAPRLTPPARPVGVPRRRGGANAPPKVVARTAAGKRAPTKAAPAIKRTSSKAAPAIKKAAPAIKKAAIKKAAPAIKRTTSKAPAAIKGSKAAPTSATSGR